LSQQDLHLSILGRSHCTEHRSKHHCVLLTGRTVWAGSDTRNRRRDGQADHERSKSRTSVLRNIQITLFTHVAASFGMITGKSVVCNAACTARNRQRLYQPRNFYTAQNVRSTVLHLLQKLMKRRLETPSKTALLFNQSEAELLQLCGC
jgi:hypothetical protein